MRIQCLHEDTVADLGFTIRDIMDRLLQFVFLGSILGFHLFYLLGFSGLEFRDTVNWGFGLFKI